MTESQWLIDGGALSDAQWLAVTQAAGCRRLYGFWKDESADRMGPVLVPGGEAATALVHALTADASRCWALSELTTDVSFDALARHLAQLIYFWTADGQRFFLRFADGRSMRMVWTALDEVQKLRVLGPVQRWRTTGRMGEAVDLTTGPQPHDPSHRTASPHRLPLSEAQFNHVLDQSWPDQLLSAVLDDAPSLAAGIGANQLHELSRQTCGWLQEVGEDRYPQQKAALAHVLTHGQGQWLEPPSFRASGELLA